MLLTILSFPSWASSPSSYLFLLKCYEDSYDYLRVLLPGRSSLSAVDERFKFLVSYDCGRSLLSDSGGAALIR